MVTRIYNNKGRFEQVFIAVKKIKDGIIYGNIWTNIELISGYHFGDKYNFPENNMIDWVISKPDGSEEGNFVGKFMDEYQKIINK